MTLGQRFVAGIKLANKSLFFTLKNMRLLLYSFIPLLAILGAGASYVVPIINILRKANATDSQQLLFFFMSNPNLFVPSLLTKVLLGAAGIILVLTMAAIVQHTANIINGRPTTTHALFATLAGSLLSLIIWSLLLSVLIYAGSRSIAGTSTLAFVVNKGIRVLGPIVAFFLTFVLPYVIVKKSSIFSAITSSIKLTWQNLLPIWSAGLWISILSTLVMALLALPVVATFYLSPLVALALTCLSLVLFILYLPTIGNVLSVILFLWANNELPTKHDVTKQ